jgi:predicted nucleic acid-binding protein
VISYLDSSALIKLYVAEAGSDRVSGYARALPHPIFEATTFLTFDDRQARLARVTGLEAAGL